MDELSYLLESFDRVWPRLVEHLNIVSISMLVAAAISLPLGIALSRVRALATPVLVVLGIVYTIPSFAFLALLVPITGLGQRSAIVALSAYALVVITRNTIVAFEGVDPSVKEAALGMGMSSGQLLRRIEVPLAMPVVLAGLRLATLSTIALATIAAWTGAGGLGLLLKDGINNPPKLYAGVICVAGMAVAADLLYRLVERRYRGQGRSTATGK
ncbi:MAG: ABC transporter permease [Chloroflexota bacterium]|nr:ABC transporter permease [Chloroflexota bacterium]MDQ5864714.1 ABC transporter permease [Chloroflexota bacterium]